MTAVLIGMALWSASWLPPPGADRAITVSAALSLTEVLEEIVAAHLRAGGAEVRLNLAPSQMLARQIVNGAPIDVFISADEAQMDVVERAGLLVGGSRTSVVGNRLAIVATGERVESVRRSFHDAPAEIRRLAIGDPTAVPAGVYARRYLEQHGLWSAYGPRIIPMTSPRAALTAVANGSADAAIVYATDLAISSRVAAAVIVPVETGPRIVYPAALIRSSRNRPQAQRFLAYLRSREAAALFEKHGFVRISTDPGG